MKSLSWFPLLSLLAASLFGSRIALQADDDTKPAQPGKLPQSESANGRYVFGWGMLPESLAKTRGGTSEGGETSLAPGRPLPLPEVAAAPNDYERDLAAILAMAGDYRVSFHFMEILGLAEDYQPVQPYHSWATEQVKVIEQREGFVSLQHTLVMYFAEDGKTSEGHVMKHWRQDWTYEDTDHHLFQGNLEWARRTRTAEEARGSWSQLVMQVDDSPRYEAVGRWEHRGNVSEWCAEPFWRPLPRREFSVRKDYDVLEAKDRIVITPTGWLHEQNNWKRVAGAKAASGPDYVAAEFGLNRYERITTPSLDPATLYWEKTGPYWQIVREEWAEVFAKNERFAMLSKVDGEPLYSHHFEDADALEQGEPFDPVAARKRVKELISRYLKFAESADGRDSVASDAAQVKSGSPGLP
jgi:hypothetical protein